MYDSVKFQTLQMRNSWSYLIIMTHISSPQSPTHSTPHGKKKWYTWYCGPSKCPSIRCHCLWCTGL